MRKHFIFTATAAAIFVTSVSSSYAGPICDQYRINYANAGAPKAFAVGVGPDGRSTCGYATATGNARAISLSDAKSKAINFCAGYNGATNCHVIMSDGSDFREQIRARNAAASRGYRPQ